MLRVVLDTNVIVSHLLIPGSLPDTVVLHALDHNRVLTSDDHLVELEHVIGRKKFDRYLPPKNRREFFYKFRHSVEMVEILSQVNACKDAADNAILEIALNGEADMIISGDADLLGLNPFRKVKIITPAAYAKKLKI